MASTQKHALVVGASGLLGAHLVSHLEESGGWDITTLSRRPLVLPRAKHNHIALDLLDRQACLDATPALAGVTQVFYGSRSTGPNYQIDHETNQAMLVNLCDALERSRDNPFHMQLVHGLKWYGFNKGPATTPAREDDAPHKDASFYVMQRDELLDRCARNGWSWSTVRPHLICAVAENSPSNIVSVIGTLAALRKAQGRPFTFPSSRAAFEARITVSDIALLCRQMIWVADTPECHGQDFNTVNGDTMRWCDLWPKVSQLFDLEAAGAEPEFLADAFAGSGTLWSELAARENLVHSDLNAMCDWHFADASLSLAWDQVASTDKLRSYGFTETLDSSEQFMAYLAAYRRQRLLP